MSNAKNILNNPKPTMPEPVPLEGSIPEVMKLTPNMLPEGIGEFVFDVAERCQCPPEYVAVSAIVALSSLIGGKCILRPKRQDDWAIRPNLWAALIGPPSAMKSPAMRAPISLLAAQEKRVAEAVSEEVKQQKIKHKLQSELYKRKQNEAADLFAKGMEGEAIKLLSDHEPEPVTSFGYRLAVNDATVEKLGELLRENPNGLLLIRDELSGLLSKLSRDDHQSERAFMLECYDGFNSFIYDRIGRGTIVIPQCILSIVGSIQPSKIEVIVQDALSGRANDGLTQRMQVSVWPEIKKGKKWKDQAPDPIALGKYEALIVKFQEFDTPDGEPLEFRFADDAQVLFMQWWEELQASIDEDELHPAIESHLGKYPKTIASLALIFQLCTDKQDCVEKPAVELALKWYSFLKSHALRMYHAFDTAKLDAAKRLLARKEKLPDTFTVRDVRRKGWAGLKDNTSINAAIDVLADHYHLIEIDIKSGGNGGRPTTGYRWNTEKKKTVTAAKLIPPKSAKTPS